MEHSNLVLVWGCLFLANGITIFGLRFDFRRELNFDSCGHRCYNVEVQLNDWTVVVEKQYLLHLNTWFALLPDLKTSFMLFFEMDRIHVVHHYCLNEVMKWYSELINIRIYANYSWLMFEFSASSFQTFKLILIIWKSE